jgi:hypothetical protein
VPLLNTLCFTRCDTSCRYIGQVYRHPLGDGTVEDYSVKVTEFQCSITTVLIPAVPYTESISSQMSAAQTTAGRLCCTVELHIKQGTLAYMLPVVAQGQWRVPANPHVGNMGLASDFPVPVTSTVPSKFGVRPPCFGLELPCAGVAARIRLAHA